MRRRAGLADRFWNKVDPNGRAPDHVPEIGACWLYTGPRDRDGYGQFKVTVTEGVARQEKAHRVAWVLTNGPLRDTDFVLHRCDNPPCVRPGHLFVGNATANRRDAANKGRIPAPTHLTRRGIDHPRAKLSEDDVREIRRLYHEEHLLQREIGERYGLHQAQVSHIILRKSWKHL